MAFEWNDEEREYLEAHVWAILATGRRDGSPQQSMIGYALDEKGRLLISVKAYTAKWKNATRQPLVSISIPDGREHLVVYGSAETIATDPLRAELTATIFAALSGNPAPDPTEIVPMLDEQERTVLRITPDKSSLHR